MEHRDRSSGWKHAKLSGHKNEDMVKALLDTDPDFQQHFLSRIGHAVDRIDDTSIGGLHETNVTSVNGKSTKSKTDLKVYLSQGEPVNVSIKKSLAGQVYFVSAEIFIHTFERQFGELIPAPVQRGIRLFWAAADDAVDVIERFADRSNQKNLDLQLRHKSLNAVTLKRYNEGVYSALLDWFTRNAGKLARLSFSMGAAADRNDWSDFVWYINLLGENDTDAIFRIEDICAATQERAERETFFSSKNGGTTIQLPFGFVQWHQKKLQFHHNYDKLCVLLAEPS